MPHAGMCEARGRKLSTLDFAAYGRFKVFTGIDGEAKSEPAASVSEEMGCKVDMYLIVPRQRSADHTGEWARAQEVSDGGCVLTRPDHHVGWRSVSLPENPMRELRRVMRNVLSKQAWQTASDARGTMGCALALAPEGGCMQMLGWRDIYTNRSENNSVSVFTVTFARDRGTQALEHDGVRVNWQLRMPVALALLLDQRGFFTRRCNSDLTLVFAIRQLPNDTMALLQRQPAR